MACLHLFICVCVCVCQCVYLRCQNRCLFTKGPPGLYFTGICACLTLPRGHVCLCVSHSSCMRAYASLSVVRTPDGTAGTLGRHRATRGLMSGTGNKGQMLAMSSAVFPPMASCGLLPFIRLPFPPLPRFTILNVQSQTLCS